MTDLASYDDIKVGNRLLCYDPRIWNKRGHDLNHNEDCWKECEILAIHHDVVCCKTSDSPGHVHETCVDVRFIYDGFVSHGHFPSSFKLLECNEVFS